MLAEVVVQQLALAGRRGELDELEAVDAHRVLEGGDLHAEVGLGVHGIALVAAASAGTAGDCYIVIVSTETIPKGMLMNAADPTESRHAPRRPRPRRAGPRPVPALSPERAVQPDQPGHRQRCTTARFGFGITEWRVIAVLGRYPDLSRERRRRAHRDGQGRGQPRGRAPAGTRAAHSARCTATTAAARC